MTRHHHHRTTVDFLGTPITATVTSTPSVVRRWLRTTAHDFRRHARRLVVGLGVQWVPDRSHGEDNDAATLQLCVGRRCLLFQLARSAAAPRLLRRFLLHPDNTFVGIWNHRDRHKLARSRHALGMARDPLDLRTVAVAEGTGEPLHRESTEVIVKECLGYGCGFRFDDRVSRSDWDEEELSEEQVQQACDDARASFLIGKDLRAWEFRL